MRNSLLLLALGGLGFVSTADATTVFCGCEHYGSATDGICEALPSQEYDQYYGLYYRYQFTWHPVGPATITNADPYSGFATYTCPPAQGCGVGVTVHEGVFNWYGPPPNGYVYINYVGRDDVCSFVTGGEG